MLFVLILYISGGTYSFKSTVNGQILWETFHGSFYLLSDFLARNLLRENRRRNTFRISFWCLAWDSNPGFSSNKPTHYLLGHGDLQRYNIFFNLIKISGKKKSNTVEHVDFFSLTVYVLAECFCPEISELDFKMNLKEYPYFFFVVLNIWIFFFRSQAFDSSHTLFFI